MIGVATKETDLYWVAEFFELFKTPWEIAIPGRRYDLLLSADDRETFEARLTLLYSSKELPIDRRLGAFVETTRTPHDVQWGDETFPVYRGVARFSGPVRAGALTAGAAAIDYRVTSGTATVYRIGYDLFEEVSHLLTRGQPASHAETPTLDLHIEFIRQCLRESGVSYVEIPARPHQCMFICCLTHDIDFCGIRRHAIDRTVVGFIARGTVGALIELVRGRRPLGEAFRNWLAVLTLPLVWLGLRQDFWQPFDDYSSADQGKRSTFFVIPFKGLAGVSPDGAIRRRRAAPYGIGDIREEIEKHSEPGTEFAVHGIDAWRDAKAGVKELKELAMVTGQHELGVRMHWLYLSDRSPRQLEDAGFAYDSTWGYNDAVGYRAGTSQVFRLAGSESLLELPLTIMDSALFYADRMGLERAEAMARCRLIVQRARQFGGTVVINWHDRSLAPERQWERPYQELLKEVQVSAVWFATAGEAVEWFKWRRAVKFTVENGSRSLRVEASSRTSNLPSASILVHRSVGGKMETEETRFTGKVQTVCL